MWFALIEPLTDHLFPRSGWLQGSQPEHGRRLSTEASLVLPLQGRGSGQWSEEILQGPALPQTGQC